MPIFGTGRKKEGPKTGNPTELVLQMRQSGLSNNQIIQNLQRMGYQTTEVFDAMSQADLKSSVDAAPIQGFDAGQIENPMSFGAPQGPPPMQMPGMGPSAQEQPPNYPSSNLPPNLPPIGLGGQGVSKDEMEELVEAIIDEKWAEISGSINKIVEWKGKVENRLTILDDQMKDMQKQFDELRQAVLNKVGEYDQHITSVGTDVKAMEQVFQKMLPLFAENVRELGRITDSMKSVSIAASDKYAEKKK